MLCEGTQQVEMGLPGCEQVVVLYCYGAAGTFVGSDTLDCAKEKGRLLTKSEDRGHHRQWTLQLHYGPSLIAKLFIIVIGHDLPL